jgi:hypothetical protein
VISFQLPSVSEVRLVVFDLLGRELAVLVNEKKAPGNYEVKFDESGLSSGVYFCQLQASDLEHEELAQRDHLTSVSNN